ncbi:ribosomal-protein-alanine acetyltransferase [Enterococcus florum]|uniref:[Ribosomal protein bS18]-alanine N-acetyltransferase n=1 Tax=Enterococcus florum TaxID=2480627 RepID=A0A4P5P3H5_9ENTE|nr:ribosomal protein S18-alanine N-acetyltransferase [Enterococcus florum]GCF92287.1 ribosomal-protein-alanine acetyltransferase [Enterococcus florum]
MIIKESINQELAEQVWEISQHAYEFGSPWPKKIFAEDIALSHSHYFILEEKQQVIGFVGVHQVLDELEVTNIAVRPEYKGQGFGFHLIQRLIDYAKEQGIVQIFLEVRASNQSARQFYGKYGFKETGLRKKYYAHPIEDAILMSMRVNEANAD